MADNNDNDSSAARTTGQYAAAEGGKPESIRAEISETRSRLSDTISEIGERLNPQLVKEQVTERVKEGIREATIGRVEHMARNAADTVNATRTSIIDTVRDNPVPAAMIAVGLGWLLFNGRRSTSVDTARRPQTDYGTSGYEDYAYDTAGDGDESRLANATHRVADAANSVRDRASDVAGRVSDRTRGAVDSARDAVASRASGIADRASAIAGSVSSRAQNVAGSVSDRAVQGRRRVEDAFHDNPLAVGAVAVALGVVAGLAAPSTERESQLFGETRDRVVDRARSVVSDVKDEAQQTVGRVVDEAKRVVQAEGAHLQEAVQNVVSAS